MKQIKDFNYNGKKVLLRLDLNVTIKNKKILSETKINESLKTINYLIDNNAKIIIMSHLGKIKTEEDKKNNTLYPVYELLSNKLNTKVYFSSATKGTILENKINNLKSGEVLLVENTRFEDLDNKSESSCNLELAKYWANLADIFINDAFGLSHRKHASNYGISKYLPTAVGFLIAKEVEGLKPIIMPKKPFIIIMGGAKISDKLDIIKGLLPKCDYLLTGGGIANSFLNCSYNVGKSLKDDEKKDELKELLKEYSEKLIIPEDVKILRDENVYEKNIYEINDEDIIYDIGQTTIEKYKNILKSASTIFINGTVGLYEDNRFENGTKEILEYIEKLDCCKIAGGGDAISSLEKFEIKNLSYISTGGGATLEYIKSEKMECFEK